MFLCNDGRNVPTVSQVTKFWSLTLKKIIGGYVLFFLFLFFPSLYITQHNFLNYNGSKLSFLMCAPSLWFKITEASFCFCGNISSKSLPCGLNECIWQEKLADRKRRASVNTSTLGNQQWCEKKYIKAILHSISVFNGTSLNIHIS